MQMNYKVTILRGANMVTQDGAKKRIESADGLRWAISKNVKLRLPGGRFDVVESWDLRERIDGRAVRVRSGVTEEYAREFCGVVS